MTVKLLGLAAVTACVYIMTKHTKPEYAPAVEIAMFVIVMLWSFPYIGQIFDMMRSAADTAGLDTGVIKTVVKLCGMSIISGFAADILEDSGASSAAGRVELCAKVIMLAMVTPYIMEIIGFVSGLID